MPKVIVLFHGADSAAATLAQKAAAGAEGVRFTEVDIRSLGPTESTLDRRRPARLTSVEPVLDYDGVIIARHAAGAPGSLPDEVSRLVEALALTPTPRLPNIVFTLLGPEDPGLLNGVARLGGIVLSAPAGIEPADARASAAGARTAKVVSWVRHALSHEQHEQHNHTHHPTDHHEHRP